MSDEGSDVTDRLRRQSWWGAKRHLKRALSLPPVHAAVRLARPVLPARVHVQRLPAPSNVRSVVADMAGARFVMLRPDRCVVAKELYWGRGRRPEPADQLALDVFGALAREAVVVLDVGAYTGVFSLLSATVNPMARVHAFEVVPEVVKGAFDNVVANDLLARVTVHACGLGRDGETVTVAVGAGGSALPDFYSLRMDFPEGAHVPTRSLDAIWPSLAGDLVSSGRVLMKIDVEGFEDVVLQHGRSMLTEVRPDILCEILYGVANVGAVEEALAGLGYRHLLVTDEGLEARDLLGADPGYRDWLLTTRDDEALAALGIPVTAAPRPAES